MPNPEKARLKEAAQDTAAWKHWGPYVSERQWGTVREDYSPDGNAWEYLPHEHARSRTYRWSEDGLAGISDDHQILCFALAFWNGKDPILKERIFGLANPQGNHGEDPKENWWYLDSTPTHSWMRWRYMYPQAEFPYADLLKVNRERSRLEREYELTDTGIFQDNKYWEITVDYAKGSPEDICAVIRIRNAGPVEATLHVLPTLWFRNTWSWEFEEGTPKIHYEDGAIVATHMTMGKRTLVTEGSPQALFCENETNTERLWGVPQAKPFPKDGINDHVVNGAATVNPALTGTKAAFWHQVTVEPGGTQEISVRLSDSSGDLGDSFTKVMASRQAEAEEFYRDITPEGATEDEADVMRQAFAGMLWSKQFYNYDIERWLDGDPVGPAPPVARRDARNAHWRHLDNYDVISMPDKWEYPWYAAWDLAFHCVPLAHVDPDFAKHQILLILREWYQHPNGQIPAYEWNFGDVNPPVHAWAALKIYQIEGSKDRAFLERVFHKLLINFTWWVNKKDSEGNNLFEGGFLGLDNIGPIDRSASLQGAHLEQSDGTSWMAMYALNLMKIAIVLAKKDKVYEDIASKFFEHFCLIAHGINSSELSHGLWDDTEGFYYDLLHCDNGDKIPLRVRSMVGLIVLYAVEVLEDSDVSDLTQFLDRRAWFLSDKVHLLEAIPHIESVGERGSQLLSIVGPQRLRIILQTMLNEGEFLSPHGIRALSQYHRDHPLEVNVAGLYSTLNYEPAESSTGMFGGNSNWRGPIWMPVNYLLIDSLRIFHQHMGDDFTVEFPTGSGKQFTLEQIADAISQRLVSLFTRGADGRRPVLGDDPFVQNDPAWRDLIPFHEYFCGDTGRGVGAPHQTGWTGLVADLIATGSGLASPKEKKTHARKTASKTHSKTAAKPKRTRKPRAEVTP